MVTASIVLYNNDRDMLRAAITSCLATDMDLRLFLIDNSQSNSLQDLVVDRRVEYFHNPSNPGFGAAHNIAIKKAMDLQSTYHLVLNPDVYYNTGVLEALINYMDQNQNIGNIMPKVTYPNGDLQYLCKLLPTPYDWIGRRFNPFKKMIEQRNNIFELRFTNYEHVMEVPYLSGCFMLLRLKALQAIGLFDEEIFMYGEETDMCRRLIDGGFKTVFYPKVQVYHHFEKGSHKSWKLTRIGINSAIYYFNKWGWLFDKRRVVINKETLRKLGRNI